MASRPRQWRFIAGALGIAVAGAAMIGFLISRPPAAVAPTTPTPLITVVTPSGPPATAGYSVADDLATNQIVVFGGIADDQATWVWNGSRWDLAQPSTSPAGRIDAAAAYDPATHLVLLFGGHGPPGTDLDDTWAWGGANWRELNRGTDSPPPSDAVMAWDPSLSQMVLVAGDATGPSTGTWVWSGSRWTRLASGLPFPPSNASLAFDPSTRQLLAAGFPPSGTTVAVSTQLWVWNGAAWHGINAADAPTAYVVLGLGWNPQSRQLLLFVTSGAHPVETWGWDGTEWQQFPVDSSFILSGVIVSSDTSLLLVGALDKGGVTPMSIQVWSWMLDAWSAA